MTGQVEDPLASVDLSDYPCLTGMCYQNVGQVTAKAGKDHDSLRDIIIDVTTGIVTEADTDTKAEPPVKDCLYWYPTGEHTLFYTVGADESMSGYTYDDRTEISTELFTEAARGYVWDEGFSEKYFAPVGNPYGLYYVGEEIYMMDLRDGSQMLLEGIRPSHSQNFLMNAAGTLLTISESKMTEDGEDAYISRLAFVSMETGEAWYFDRSEPMNQIHEDGAKMFAEAPNDYVMTARAKDGEAYYLYLYRFIP